MREGGGSTRGKENLAKEKKYLWKRREIGKDEKKTQFRLEKRGTSVKGKRRSKRGRGGPGKKIYLNFQGEFRALTGGGKTKSKESSFFLEGPGEGERGERRYYGGGGAGLRPPRKREKGGKVLGEILD